MSNGRASKRNGYRYPMWDQQFSPIEPEPTYTDDEISELNRQMTNPLGIPPSELMRQNFDPAAQFFTGQQPTKAWPGELPTRRPPYRPHDGSMNPLFGQPVRERDQKVYPPFRPSVLGPDPRQASVQPPEPPPPPPQHAPWPPSLAQSPAPPQPDPRGWRPYQSSLPVLPPLTSSPFLLKKMVSPQLTPPRFLKKKIWMPSVLGQAKSGYSGGPRPTMWRGND